MTPITFCLAIPHTPWKPERVESIGRLLIRLGSQALRQGEDLPTMRVFQDREPNWSWSEKLWTWATTTGATHLVQLQDDVQVCDNFWTHLRAMVEAIPDEIIGLESVFAPGGTWYTSGDGLIGVGYVMPTGPAFGRGPSLSQLLDWRSPTSTAREMANDLRPGAIQALNEDQLIGLYAYANRYPIWHPCPTIIDHDISIPSTYGNDHHTHRRPVKTMVRGEPAPASWAKPSQRVHIPRMYQATPYLCRRHVRGYSYERFLEDVR